MIHSDAIDEIVREVLRRLATRAQSAHGTSTPNSIQPPNATAPTETTLVLAERLITTELLRGRLAGIKQLQVSPRALVTPLVKDLLKDHRIELSRKNAVETGGDEDRSPEYSVGLYVHGGGSDVLLSQIRSNGLSGREMLSVHNDLEVAISTVRGPLRRLIVISPDWPRIVYDIHRNTSLRAVAVEGIESARQAAAIFDPEVIVINPTTTNLIQQRAVLQLYLQLGTK